MRPCLALAPAGRSQSPTMHVHLDMHVCCLTTCNLRVLHPRPFTAAVVWYATRDLSKMSWQHLHQPLGLKKGVHVRLLLLLSGA